MASQPINPKTNNPYRPMHLPPPTTLPLRHCSHNEDSTPIDESSCLLSLVSPNPELKRNKEHYILATADPPSPEKVAASSTGDAKKRKRDEYEAVEAMRRAKSLRISARAVPGVPIIYVKRSVMILEPMSTPSEDVREGFERGKFRAGLDGDSTLGKRKRGEDEGKKKAGAKKAKGPNPLSAKKPKKRAKEGDKQAPIKREARDRLVAESAKDGPENGPEQQQDGETAPKPKRKRRHNKSAKRDGGEDDGAGPSETAAAESME